MDQIREQVHILSEKCKETFAAYKVTAGTIVLAAFFFAVTYMLEYEFDIDLYFDYHFDCDLVLRGLVFFAFAAFFSEACFVRRKAWKIAGFAVGALVAALAVWSFELDDTVQVAWTNGGVVNEWAHRFMEGYLLLLTIMALYICFRRSGDRFEEYLVKVFWGICLVSIFFLGLEMGMALVATAFDVLFLKGHANLTYVVSILLFGIYYVPGCIMVVTNTKQKTEDYLRGIIKELLCGMTICALVVVYLYFAKILLVREIPSNEIFGIVSWLFGLGMPMWIMAVFFDDDTKYSHVLRVLPYVFAPLILLQIYSVGVRIYEYGVTPDRYMGVMLIFFEIGVILIWRFSKDKLERIMLFLCGCIVVAVFVPGINMYSVSNRWQRTFLSEYYEKVQEGVLLSELEYERLKGSYQYLNLQKEAEEITAVYNIYSDDFVALLEDQEVNRKDMTKLETHSLHCCQMVGELDVSGYEHMDMLNQDTCYDTAYNGYIDVDFTRFRFVIRETGEEIIVDIDDFARRCIDYEKEHPDVSQEEISLAMKPYQEIRIDENTVLYMNHFQLKYSEGVKEGEAFSGYSSMSVSAMLLRK